MKKIESLGWGFFLIVWVLLAPLCVFLILRFTYEEVIEFPQQVGLGLFISAGLAAVIAWASNSLLQRHHERVREAERAAQPRQVDAPASKAKGAKGGGKKKKKR